MDTLPTIEEVARRGLKYNQQIDRLLGDIWRDFIILEPEIAAMLENTFGSAELATLMITGRVNNHPSFLEELAQKNISKNNFESFIHQGSYFIAQIKDKYKESERREATENKFGDQKKLSHLANRVRKNYERELVSIFNKLKEEDFEIASMALGLWNDVVQTAEFLTMPAKGLASKSPLQVIEEGERQKVLDLIGRLEHGIPS